VNLNREYLSAICSSEAELRAQEPLYIKFEVCYGDRKNGAISPTLGDFSSRF
jgi:hypothetical protein